jgi:hypothetical protein
MLKGAPMIKEEGVYGFEPSFIKGNSKLLNLYSKVLNTYIGNYSIHKTATGAPLSIVFNSLMCVVDIPIELNIFNISLSPSMINLSRSDCFKYLYWELFYPQNCNCNT